jgi:hypothetical protein
MPGFFVAWIMGRGWVTRGSLPDPYCRPGALPAKFHRLVPN